MAASSDVSRVVVARRVTFSSAHFYAQPAFSDEENRETFGACFNPHGHGHDYVVEAVVSGLIDANTRWVMDLASLDEILAAVVKPLDHRHLNFEIVEFKTQIPTTENLALYLWPKVQALVEGTKGLALERLRLFETPELWVEVRK